VHGQEELLCDIWNVAGSDPETLERSAHE